jgi:hypothetical protein
MVLWRHTSAVLRLQPLHDVTADPFERGFLSRTRMDLEIRPVLNAVRFRCRFPEAERDCLPCRNPPVPVLRPPFRRCRQLRRNGGGHCTRDYPRYGHALLSILSCTLATASHIVNRGNSVELVYSERQPIVTHLDLPLLSHSRFALHWLPLSPRLC